MLITHRIFKKPISTLTQTAWNLKAPLESRTFTGNVILGQVYNNHALFSNNANFGYLALNDITTGTANTAYGHASLASTISGSFNTASGSYSLFNNKIGIAIMRVVIQLYIIIVEIIIMLLEQEPSITIHPVVLILH